MADIALEVRGLTRSYGKLVAVKELDLTVKAGDVYGFLGPNGAGKTTAMRCILGLIRRDRGDVAIFGDNDLVRARAMVGAIIETPAFHSWLSGLDNLRQAAAYSGLSNAQAAKEIARVLERVGLTERAKDPAGKYSLGMKQRLGIARALLGRPKLMLLDEPTNGLDPAGMREMRDLIRSLALHDNITVFISSHLLGEVQAICNRVGIIRDGTLRREGDVQELLAVRSEGRFAEIGSPTPDQVKAIVGAIEGVEVIGPGQSGWLQIRHDTVELSTINKRLVEADVPIDALVPKKRDLEDVFMEVTR